ncbi:MAG: ScyD/ScyE family protein [Massilia sp.]
MHAYQRLALILGLLVAAAVQAAPKVEVIATGLSNPRGIAFAPNGQLFVAEAGRGGNGNCALLGDGQNACYGETGALTRIDPTGVEAPVQIISGLPSLAPAGGFGAAGPSGIDFPWAGHGQLAIGLGAAASVRPGLGAKSALFGHLLTVTTRGKWKLGADIAGFEFLNNPVPGGNDSNPYSVAALPARQIVADAGGNSLTEVGPTGKMRTLATFPSRLIEAPPFLGLPPGTMIPMQAVPTAVKQGPDGSLYVGQLTGFPFPVGAANVYRIPPHGGTPQVFASGFTNIVGLAFDVLGRLYVLEIGSGFAGPGGPPLKPPGRLVRVNHDQSHSVIYDQLYYPGGVEIGRDGHAYVTNFGIVPGRIPGAFPDGGQVLRISLDYRPGH